jgi:hypothetical protein
LIAFCRNRLLKGIAVATKPETTPRRAAVQTAASTKTTVSPQRKAATSTAPALKPTGNAVKPKSRRKTQGASQNIKTRVVISRLMNDEEKNAAPSQWGRRLARLVGDKFGVKMSNNWSKNEGTWRKKDIVIKCAKSTMPPVSVLVTMLDRIDQLWAVYITEEGAEVWAVDVDKVRQHGYFTHGPNVQKRVEIYRRKIANLGKLIGQLTVEEVESCRIP